MPTLRRTSFVLAAAAAVLAAAPAAAQSGNNSDNSGFIPSGSGAHSGSFLGPGLRTENEMFARNGDRVTFRNARTGCALRGAERAYRDSIAATTPTAAEARVQTLLGARDGTGDADAVAAALAHGAAPDSPLGRAARSLADALNGLMRDRGACGADRDSFDEAPQWQEAIRAFNDYIHNAPDSAFSPPAPELLAIHDALQSVVYHTLRNPNAP
ncbi:MAG TPA: hypothetical protein VLK66_04510 [Longimicrobium sp.]|nr:hypothetical protein [Longimicrobium sp.]